MAKKRMQANEDGKNVNESSGKAGGNMAKNLAEMKKNAAPKTAEEPKQTGGEEEEKMLQNGDLNGIIFTSEGLEYESTTD